MTTTPTTTTMTSASTPRHPPSTTDPTPRHPTTTTWTTTSDEQHVKPQNHTVIVSKLQRSIVTFSSIEDRKKEE